MILTDREIQLSIKNGQLTIDPNPDPASYSSTSVDLTLHRDGLKWKAAPGFPIQPGIAGYKYTSTRSMQENINLDNWHFTPRSFILAWTRERITLPTTSRLAARVEGKSSLARLGMGVHITAPTIHAGFNAPLQLEMFNLGEQTIILNEGMKICQLIFEMTLGTPQAGYAGIFAGQGFDTP